MRHQENFGEAHLRAADGLVAHKPRFVMSDDFLLMAAPYRACAGSARRPSSKEASQHFLTVAYTPPHDEEYRAYFMSSMTTRAAAHDRLYLQSRAA
jgi:hypothetical protein